jgi:hypothetical protein
MSRRRQLQPADLAEGIAAHAVTALSAMRGVSFETLMEGLDAVAAALDASTRGTVDASTRRLHDLEAGYLVGIAIGRRIGGAR